MNQADAWRYRPLASELRNARYNLRPQWDSWLRNEMRESTRVADAYASYRSRQPWYKSRGFWDVIRGASVLGYPQAALQTWGIDESDVARSGRAPQTEYSPGTYDANAVPWRGSGGWARNPKGWLDPDQPWPTEEGGGGGGTKGRGKNIYSTVRYTPY